MLGLSNALFSSSSTEQRYGLALDGTGDYLSLGNQDLIGDGDFSISVWAKHTGQDYANDTWVGKYQDGSNNWFFGAKSADPPVVYFYSEVGGSDKTVLQGTTNLDGSEFTNGSWHHFVVSCDRNGNEIIYIDGVLEVSASGEDTDLDNTGDLQIGAFNAGSGMQGFIDHVAIFSVALDADAVSAMYNDGKPFDLNLDRGDYDNSSGLVGYWKMFDGPFDDKANSVVHDAHNPGYGAEIVPEPDFADIDDWTVANADSYNTITLSGGVVTFDWGNGGTGTDVYITDASLLTVGKTYKATINITEIAGSDDSDRLRVHYGSSLDAFFPASVGTHSVYFQSEVTYVTLAKSSASPNTGTVKIDHFSVKQLNGYPGIAAADATHSTNTPDDQTMSNVLTLDGVNDYLSTQADSTAATRGYSFWARSTETGQNRSVFSHSGSNSLTGTFSFNWTVDVSDGSLRNKPIITLEDTNNGFIYFDTTDKQDDGNWHHWFVYIDPTEINNCKCWVDGVTLPESTKGALSAGANAYGPLRIGGGNEYFNGDIDQFAVFDTLLGTDADADDATYAIASLAGEMWEGGDTDIANWTRQGDNTQEVDDGALHVMYGTEGGGNDDGSRINLYKTADGGYLNSDLIMGRTYKFTCEVKVGAGDTVKINLGEAISTGAITSTTYTTVTLYYTPMSGLAPAYYAYYPRLRFNELNADGSAGDNGAGEVWIKSISLIDTEARKNDLTEHIGNYDSEWRPHLLNYWKMGDGASDEPGDGIIHDQITLGAELLPNISFDSATTGWTAVGSGVSLSVVNNALRVTNSGGSNDYAREHISTLVVGKTYSFEFTVIGGNNYSNVYLGTTSVSSTGDGYKDYYDAVAVADGSYSVDFVATSADLHISLGSYATDSQYVDYDNISVREVTYAGYGAELVTNGDFATDSDWNENSNWEIRNGTAVADGSANLDINQVITSHPVANNVYKVTFDVASVTAGSVHFTFGGATGADRDSVGTYSEYITASNTDRLKIDSHLTNLFAGSIDNISVKKLNGDPGITTSGATIIKQPV